MGDDDARLAVFVLHMPRLQFDFDAVKLGQALAFLSSSISDLTKLKAAKLLYFADKAHLVKYGRPITGDRYYCLDHGPIPSASLNAINDFLSPVRIRVGKRTLENHMSKALGEYLHVDRKGLHPRLRSRVEIGALDALTGTEREVLQGTAQAYGRLAAGRLIDLTHQEKTWVTSNNGRTPGSSAEIPWELFLEDADGGASAEVREHIADQQEADSFLRALTRSAQR